MADIEVEGFEWGLWNRIQQAGWSVTSGSPTPSTTTGTYHGEGTGVGNYSMRLALSSILRTPIYGTNAKSIAFWLKWSTSGATAWTLRFRANTGSAQDNIISFELGDTGEIRCYNHGTFSYSSWYPLTNWATAHWMCFVLNSTSVDLYIDGTLAQSFTVSSNTGSNEVWMDIGGASIGSIYIDDFLMDSTAAEIPETHIKGLIASDAGAVTGLTLVDNGGIGFTANWEVAAYNVETETGDPGNWNEGATTGLNDLYLMGVRGAEAVLPSFTSCVGVKVSTLGARDGGIGQLQNQIRSGSTTTTGTSEATGASYAFAVIEDVWELNPTTSAEFTYSELVNLQAGAKVLT